ncbi:DNA-binding response OmpR family regulator [Janthinobacterium sp. CAN_S1]|uniref:response regulator transcription factor n=1 Tax=Janthinobacterium sp. CAN_S1 TaxID=2787725 RepID=UPI001A2E1A0A
MTIDYPCAMLNLILLEDEAVLRQELAEFLGDCGYRVTAVADMAAFHACYAPALHRIAVIDLGLPDGEGMLLVRALREQGRPIGIVVFTARGTTRDKVNGLSGGADYYLPKSADLDELAATLGALVRRLGESAAAVSVAPVTAWVLELGPRRLLPPGGEAIALSQQDATVLHVLMAEPEHIVSRQQIVQSMDEDFLSYDQRRLDTQISRLRRKVEQACGMTLPINTARNAGYQFYADAQVCL